MAPVKNKLLYVSTWLQSTEFQREMMRVRIFVSWALFRWSYHSSTMATLFLLLFTVFYMLRNFITIFRALYFCRAYADFVHCIGHIT